MMNVQYVIVALVLIGAVLYLGRTLYKSTKGHACDSADCKHAIKK